VMRGPTTTDEVVTCNDLEPTSARGDVGLSDIIYSPAVSHGAAVKGTSEVVTGSDVVVMTVAVAGYGAFSVGVVSPAGNTSSGVYRASMVVTSSDFNGIKRTGRGKVVVSVFGTPALHRTIEINTTREEGAKRQKGEVAVRDARDVTLSESVVSPAGSSASGRFYAAVVVGSGSNEGKIVQVAGVGLTGSIISPAGYTTINSESTSVRPSSGDLNEGRSVRDVSDGVGRVLSPALRGTVGF